MFRATVPHCEANILLQESLWKSCDLRNPVALCEEVTAAGARANVGQGLATAHRAQTALIHRL